MTSAEDARMDSAIRSAWAESSPDSGHLDEAAWKRFLEHGLDASAEETAREHIASCSRCADVFKSARSAALAQIPAEMPGRQRAFRPWPQVATAGAVAVAVVVLLLGRPASTPSASSALDVPGTVPATEKPIAPRPKAEKAPIVVSAELLLATRGNARDAAFVKELAAALEPYERDDFSEAVIRLGRLATTYPSAFEPTFYRGVSLLMDGRGPEAIAVLERANGLASEARRAESTRWLEAARAAASAR